MDRALHLENTPQLLHLRNCVARQCTYTEQIHRYNGDILSIHTVKYTVRPSCDNYVVIVITVIIHTQLKLLNQSFLNKTERTIPKKSQQIIQNWKILGTTSFQQSDTLSDRKKAIEMTLLPLFFTVFVLSPAVSIRRTNEVWSESEFRKLRDVFCFVLDGLFSHSLGYQKTSGWSFSWWKAQK